MALVMMLIFYVFAGFVTKAFLEQAPEPRLWSMLPSACCLLHAAFCVSSTAGVSLETEEAEWARSSYEGVTVFECVLEDSRDDVNILCICRPCDEGLPGVGSRAAEHGAFCLRGREVSSIAVFGVLHVWLEASLEAGGGRCDGGLPGAGPGPRLGGMLPSVRERLGFSGRSGESPAIRAS